MLLMKFVHYIAMAALLGPLISAEILNRMAAKANSPDHRLDEAQVALGRIANFGLVTLFITGFALLFLAGWHMSLKQQPWLHVMITAALVSGAFLGIAGGRARRMLELPPAERASARRSVSIFRGVALGLSALAIASGVWRI